MAKESQLKAVTAKATYEAGEYAPVKPGEQIPQIGAEVRRRQQLEGAVTTHQATQQQIDREEAAMLEKWAQNFGTHYATDPGGLQIKHWYGGIDEKRQQEYLGHIGDIKRPFDQRRATAALILSLGMGGSGGGNFGKSYLGALGSTEGRAEGRALLP
jgi:hypothetical protein